MIRRLASCIVVVVGMVSPAFAQGGGREWLEKMSGPELEGWEFRLPLFCIWSNAEKSEVVWQYDFTRTLSLLRDGAARRFCFDVAYASFNNVDRNEVSELVNAQRWEGSAVYRFDGLKSNRWLTAFEPGVAVGSMGFLTNLKRESRLQVSPRLVIKPFKLWPSARGELWSSVFSVTARAQWMSRGVTDTDIGVASYEPFRDGWLNGIGLAINLGELIR